MKVFTIVLLLSLWSKSCEKLQQNTLVKGKVVHRSCATIAVQVLDEKHFDLGQDKWQQSEGQPVYNNVFSVANQCSFPSEIKVGQEFSFMTVIKDTTMEDCILCEMWDNPPAKKQIIKVLQ